MLIDLGSEAIGRIGDVSVCDGSSAREVLTQGVYRIDSVILLSRAKLGDQRDHGVGESCLGVEKERKEKEEKRRKEKEREKKEGRRKQTNGRCP